MYETEKTEPIVRGGATRHSWRSFVGWASLWILGPYVLPMAASVIASVAVAFLDLAPLDGLFDPDIALLAQKRLYDLVYVGFVLGLGWAWARSGTTKVLSVRVEDNETLDSRTLGLSSSTRDARRVNGLAMVPFVVAVGLYQANARWGVETLPGFWIAMFTLVVAVFVVAYARRLRAPSLTITPTSVRLTRPMLPDRDLPLVEVRCLDRDLEGDLWIVTNDRRILAGRSETAVPHAVRAALTQTGDHGPGSVDPELERLRERPIERSAE